MHPHDKGPIYHSVSNQMGKLINDYERWKVAFFALLKDICSKEDGYSNLRDHNAIAISTSQKS